MTSEPALKSLSITAFRGSSQTLKLDFEKGKKLTLIYGENGTGKTTICDAFEFLAKGELGSLQDKGLGSGLHKYWPTAGRPAGDLVVKLETSAGACVGRLQSSKVSVLPVELTPQLEILRRQQVLRLIEAAPAERYKEIQRFIDIEAFERSEGALRQLVKDLTTERNAAAAAELQALESLRAAQEIAGALGKGDPVVWARAETARAIDDVTANLAKLSRLRQAFLGLKGLPERSMAAGEALKQAQAAADASDAEFMQAKSKVADDASETLSVLEAGLTFLEGKEVDACPLCESSERTDGLVQRVSERIQVFQSYREVRSRWSAAGETLNAAKLSLERVKAEFEAARGRFNAELQASAELLGNPLPSAPPEHLAELDGWLTGMDAEFERWSTLEASWRDSSQAMANLRKALESYDEKHGRLQEIDAIRPKADAALELCQQERQSFTTTLIGEIAKDVGELYDMVHPGEGLEKIAFPLDPKKRASLELSAEFDGEGRPPQAYFSQSHLDTLGLCVFLALAKRGESAGTILVLDDILGSVDEPHVERVIEMIYEISGSFRHTLVTTHYRPWREKYRWGWLKNGQCQFVELTSWDLKDGMRITTSMPEVARLKDMLAQTDIDAQTVCGKAGVILEAMLDYLTLKYECRVPRRLGDAYTLGDLLPAVEAKLKDALRVEVRMPAPDAAPHLEIQLKPLFDELSRIAQARNAFGAHFKAIGMHLPEQDAIAFARQVEALADALICPDHGWPSNGKSGSYWRNGGDTRRLHPLRRPG